MRRSPNTVALAAVFYYCRCSLHSIAACYHFPWRRQAVLSSTMARVCCHGPRNYHVKNWQMNSSNSCNSNCNLAATKILSGVIYVVVFDALVPWETEAPSPDNLFRVHTKGVMQPHAS